MQKFRDVVQRLNGSAVNGASVLITLNGVTATIYSDDGVTTQANPITTGQDGEYSFYAANGRYSIAITATGFSADSVTDVLLYDPTADRLTFYDFGAAGDNTTDDTSAVNAAIAAHLASGIPLECGKGTFKVSSQILIDVTTLLKTTGMNIRGAGRRETILSSTYTGGIPFYVTATTGGAFYQAIRDIGFQGTNNSGPVLQIGRDDYADAFNSCAFTGLNVNNSGTNAASEGYRLNFVLQSDIDIVGNGSGSGQPGTPTAPGNGYAGVWRQVQFCRGSAAFGNANVGLYITGGYTYGNAIFGVDVEEVETGIKIDSSNASKNIFIGGTNVAKYNFDCSAGNGNMFIGMVTSLYTGGTYFNGTNRTGTTMLQPGYSQGVNQIQLIDALAGSTAVAVVRSETDTNVSAALRGKGTGGGVLQDGGGANKVQTNTTGIGFNAATPVAKGTITGSRGANAALASLLTYLASRGDITDSTTA